MEIFINSLIVLVSCSAILGILLVLATKKFKVKTDEKLELLMSILPCANCGACGFSSCESYAIELLKGEDVNRCVIGGDAIATRIADTLGKEMKSVIRKIAIILCKGGSNCKNRYIYNGVIDCRIINTFDSGYKECVYGCLGGGNCAKVCRFGAITYKKFEVPKIDITKCIGCGECIKSCPKDLIVLVDFSFKYHILCKSHNKGSFTRKICEHGCTGCKACIRACRLNNIGMTNNLAVMNYKFCDNCGKCLESCPRGVISKLPT